MVHAASTLLVATIAIGAASILAAPATPIPNDANAAVTNEADKVVGTISHFIREWEDDLYERDFESDLKAFKQDVYTYEKDSKPPVKTPATSFKASGPGSKGPSSLVSLSTGKQRKTPLPPASNTVHKTGPSDQVRIANARNGPSKHRQQTPGTNSNARTATTKIPSSSSRTFTASPLSDKDRVENDIKKLENDMTRANKTPANVKSSKVTREYDEDLFERDYDEDVFERDYDEDIFERDFDDEIFERDYDQDFFERDDSNLEKDLNRIELDMKKVEGPSGSRLPGRPNASKVHQPQKNLGLSKLPSGKSSSTLPGPNSHKSTTNNRVRLSQTRNMKSSQKVQSGSAILDDEQKLKEAEKQLEMDLNRRPPASSSTKTRVVKKTREYDEDLFERDFDDEIYEREYILDELD